jgi:hypothetical protein
MTQIFCMLRRANHTVACSQNKSVKSEKHKLKMEPPIHRIHRIKAYETKIFQKTLGGLDTHLQMRLGLARVAELNLQREAWADRIYNRVAAKRAEAAARGVHVVVDDTRPDAYIKVRFYD